MNISAQQPNTPEQQAQAEELRRLYDEKYVSARTILEQEFRVEVASCRHEFKVELNSAIHSATAEAEQAYNHVRREAEDTIAKLNRAMEEQRPSYQKESTEVSAKVQGNERAEHSGRRATGERRLCQVCKAGSI